MLHRGLGFRHVGAGHVFLESLAADESARGEVAIKKLSRNNGARLRALQALLPYPRGAPPKWHRSCCLNFESEPPTLRVAESPPRFGPKPAKP